MNTWLEFERRFDSKEMLEARRKLAEDLEAKTTNPKRILETLLCFFEDLGTLYLEGKQGYINRRLADSSFGFYACRWWAAAINYVNQERLRQGGDPTIFQCFEAMAKQMALERETIDQAAIHRFLEDESRLV